MPIHKVGDYVIFTQRPQEIREVVGTSRTQPVAYWCVFRRPDGLREYAWFYSHQLVDADEWQDRLEKRAKELARRAHEITEGGLTAPPKS